MNRNETIQNRRESSTGVIEKIKDARTGAQAKMNAYKNLTAKRHDYWRAVAALNAHNQALYMFERGAEQQIPDMAATAIADFEYAHNDDPTATEMTLAITDGRRDALTSVAEWMDNKENSR